MRISLSSIIFFSATILLTSILIHNLGDIVRLVAGQGGEDYAVIMEQLQDATLSYPYILIAALSFLFSFLITRNKKFIISLLIAVPSIIILLASSLYFTDVNTIRFGTVLQLLINAILHGAL